MMRKSAVFWLLTHACFFGRTVYAIVATDECVLELGVTEKEAVRPAPFVDRSRAAKPVILNEWEPHVRDRFYVDPGLPDARREEITPLLGKMVVLGDGGPAPQRAVLVGVERTPVSSRLRYYVFSPKTGEFRWTTSAPDTIRKSGGAEPDRGLPKLAAPADGNYLPLLDANAQPWLYGNWDGLDPSRAWALLGRLVTVERGGVSQPEVLIGIFHYPPMDSQCRELYYRALEKRFGEFRQLYAKYDDLRRSGVTGERLDHAFDAALETIVEFGRTASAFRQFRDGNWGLYGPMIHSMTNRLGYDIAWPGYLDVLFQGATEQSLKPFFRQAVREGIQFFPEQPYERPVPAKAGG